MADLRSNFESTLVTLRNQPFEARWARYWSMVLEALEYAPETMEHLNRLIVNQEEHIAEAERRPTVAKMLGAEREQLRREADAAVMELLEPFFSSEGSREERAALADERRRIRSEIHPHAQRADGAEAYETYVLVLDYATAFASASSAAFRTAEVPRPVARPAPQRQPRMDAPPAQTRPRPEPAAIPQRQQQPAPPSREAPPPEHRPQQYRQPPAQPHDPRPYRQQRDQAPYRDPQQQPPRQQPPPQRQPVPHERRVHEPWTPEALDRHPDDPMHDAEPREQHRPRKRRTGLFIAAGIVICLIGASAAAYVFKPGWFDVSTWPLVAQGKKPSGNVKPAEELPSTPLDRYHKAILEQKGEQCSPPADIANSSWEEVSAFVECTKSKSAELISAFRFMLSQGGGKWLGSDSWTAPEGPMQLQLTSAWAHIDRIRSHWEAQVSTTVKEFGTSYFGLTSHGTTGWRFTVWRCRCNVNSEFIADDVNNVKPRLFITRPVLINTEDEAKLAYNGVSLFFLGPNAPGKKEAVEKAINDAHLPYNLNAGPGIAKPFKTEEEAQKAWDEVTEMHRSIGFEINELKWAAN